MTEVIVESSQPTNVLAESTKLDARREHTSRQTRRGNLNLTRKLSYSHHVIIELCVYCVRSRLVRTD
jgi:hypothetical protein